MVAKRMESWDAGDFGRCFRGAAARSTDDTFRKTFSALAETLEPMDREFCKETVGCGRNLSAVLDEVQSIAARMGYCERPRGFEGDCRQLYQDVARVTDRVEALRQSCFL